MVSRARTASRKGAKLSSAVIARRAAAVRLVLTDVDGCLTDAGAYYGESGEVLKRFSVRDGMGVARLRNAGIETALITGELSPSVSRRAEKLKIQHVWLGVADKLALLPRVLEATGLAPEAILFFGDDLNDLPLMRAIGEHGLTAAPADAMPEVTRVAHHRAAFPGGHGAFRDVAEWLLQKLPQMRTPRREE